MQNPAIRPSTGTDPHLPVAMSPIFASSTNPTLSSVDGVAQCLEDARPPARPLRPRNLVPRILLECL